MVEKIDMERDRLLLMRYYQEALQANIMLSSSLHLLSIAASRIYGEELDAEICAGGEIEFRTANDPDGLNSISLRIKDILGKNEAISTMEE